MRKENGKARQPGISLEVLKHAAKIILLGPLFLLTGNVGKADKKPKLDDKEKKKKRRPTTKQNEHYSTPLGYTGPASAEWDKGMKGI